MARKVQVLKDALAEAQELNRKFKGLLDEANALIETLMALNYKLQQELAARGEGGE